MTDLVALVADRDAWYALARVEQIHHITAALGIPCDAAAMERLSIVPPGWMKAVKQSTGHREYGFPADPSEGDVHAAWDGSRWRYTSIPWWERIDDGPA